MSSVGNPTYEDGYIKDCSQPICSIYCPQWCHVIFPPPDSFDDSGTNFSPLIIAVIAILASAILLVCFYTLISKFCRRRTDRRNHRSAAQSELNSNQMTPDRRQVGSTTGLDEALIKSIPVRKYKKLGDGSVEVSTDCAVCLNKFREDESLRVLPKCKHAFHIPCIDEWLRSNSNCPLCRANVAFCTNPLPLRAQNSSTPNVASLEIQRRNDLIVVVDNRDRERGHREEAVVSHGCSDGVPTPKNPFQATGELENSEIGRQGVRQFR